MDTELTQMLQTQMQAMNIHTLEELEEKVGRANKLKLIQDL